MQIIRWNEVTKLSQITAIVLFVVVFSVGFWLGKKSEIQTILGKNTVSAKFACDEGKFIYTDFYKNFVHLKAEKIDVFMHQTISASGAHYANFDESIIFWNKGDTAFITENGFENITYKNCLLSP